MNVKKGVPAFLILIFLSVPAYAQTAAINHTLTIKADPGNHFIEVEDTITVPEESVKEKIPFLLHGNLTVNVKSEKVFLVSEKGKLKSADFGVDDDHFFVPTDIPVKFYSINLKKKHKGDLTFTLTYNGKLNHELETVGAEYAKGFSETPGIISEEGIFLSGSTFWVPWLNEKLITFTMEALMPEPWECVSQGRRAIHTKENNQRKIKWESLTPTDEVLFIGAKFSEYGKEAEGVNIMAFLRTPDEKLASKYIDATQQYLNMYQKLIGPFPYWKFALVENFWETGYGMPSLTLLGSKIIRFPFILNSSYPHELLHNYWGNGVFVDYDSGNWSEGLTAFMADHLISEQMGKGEEYRSQSLQKYRDYVNSGNDFALTSFRSRYNDSSEAIGYAKSMMVWNMLRQKVGDSAFVKAIQKFYETNKYKRAGFEEIRRSFEEVTSKDLRVFFDQWIKRTGAPELKLSRVSVKEENQVFSLTFTLTQLQNEAPYALNIPVAIYPEGEKEGLIKWVDLEEKEKSYQFIFKTPPLRVDIDPQFNIFRKLNRNEISPSLSQAFGSEKVLIVLPVKAKPEMLEAYKKLAENRAQDKSKRVEIIFDDKLTTITPNTTVWFLGWENIHKEKIVKELGAYDTQIADESVRFMETSVPVKGSSFVIALSNPEYPDSAFVWLASDNHKALPGLARKLPHYGKYSYLAFEGDEPVNINKGIWPLVNSPLSAEIKYPKLHLLQRPVSWKLPKRKPLSDLPKNSQE